MDKKFFAGVMIMLIGMLFLTVGVLTAAEEATQPPQGELLLKSPWEKAKTGPTPFNHEEHVKAGIACTECHHIYENGKNVWKEGMPVQPCNACHKEKKEGDMDSFQNAFHKNCRNCHRDLDKEGKPSGPWKKCNDCHEKKKS